MYEHWASPWRSANLRTRNTQNWPAVRGLALQMRKLKPRKLSDELQTPKATERGEIQVSWLPGCMCFTVTVYSLVLWPLSNTSILRAETMCLVCFIVSQGANDSPAHQLFLLATDNGTFADWYPHAAICWCHSLCSSVAIYFTWLIWCLWFLGSGTESSWRWMPGRDGIHHRGLFPRKLVLLTPQQLPFFYVLGLVMCVALFSPTLVSSHFLAVRRDEMQSLTLCVCVSPLWWLTQHDCALSRCVEYGCCFLGCPYPKQRDSWTYLVMGSARSNPWKDSFAQNFVMTSQRQWKGDCGS